MEKENGISTNQDIGEEHDIAQSRHGERTWDIPQSRQERNKIGLNNEEIGRMTTQQADITSILCNLLKQQSALDVDLDIFDGNPLEYHNFMILLHELVETQIDDPRRRLMRYTKYDPKDIIQQYVQ